MCLDDYPCPRCGWLDCAGGTECRTLFLLSAVEEAAWLADFELGVLLEDLRATQEPAAPPARVPGAFHLEYHRRAFLEAQDRILRTGRIRRPRLATVGFAAGALATCVRLIPLRLLDSFGRQDD